MYRRAIPRCSTQRKPLHRCANVRGSATVAAGSLAASTARCRLLSDLSWRHLNHAVTTDRATRRTMSGPMPFLVKRLKVAETVPTDKRQTIGRGPRCSQVARSDQRNPKTLGQRPRAAPGRLPSSRYEPGGRTFESCWAHHILTEFSHHSTGCRANPRQTS